MSASRRGWGWGVFFRGDRERLVVKNSVFKAHLSCQRADTGHPGTRGLFCTECGHWPSFCPPPPPQHPTYKTLLSRLISSVLYCRPDLNELPCSSQLLSGPPTPAFCGASHFVNNLSNKKPKNYVYNKYAVSRIQWGTENGSMFNGLMSAEVGKNPYIHNRACFL